MQKKLTFWGIYIPVDTFIVYRYIYKIQRTRETFGDPEKLTDFWGEEERRQPQRTE